MNQQIRFLVLCLLVALGLVALLALQFQTLRRVEALRATPTPQPAVVALCATPEATTGPVKSGLLKQQATSSPSGAR